MFSQTAGICSQRFCTSSNINFSTSQVVRSLYVQIEKIVPSTYWHERFCLWAIQKPNDKTIQIPFLQYLKKLPNQFQPGLIYFSSITSLFRVTINYFLFEAIIFYTLFSNRSLKFDSIVAHRSYKHGDKNVQSTYFCT